jgi:putative two-component system response regulator
LAERLALECGIHSAVARRIRIAALGHDIGKLKIPESIRNKPGRLTSDEFEIMKTHTVLGAKMLSKLPGELKEMAQNISLWHHEFYNGEGYWGRFTDELPLYTSITAISDVYTALTNIRVYKNAWTEREALDYIQSQSGKQFNPKLVKVFHSYMRTGGLG